MSGLKLLLAIFMLLTITSCTLLQNVFQNKKTTQSYLTYNIFLAPESLSFKKVYLVVRNSTIHQSLDVENLVKESLTKKNYSITEGPINAEIVMNVNIRYYGIFEREILNAMLEDRTKKEVTVNSNQGFSDFSNTIKPSRYNMDYSGVVIGAATGFGIFSTLTAALIGGAMLGGAGIALEHIFAPQIILAVLDVSLSEKLPFSVKQQYFNQISYGEGGNKKVEYESSTTFRNLQTQVIVVSRGLNLDDKRALNDVKKQIVASLSGFF